MEIADVVLEYLKVLVWPIVIIILILKFEGSFEKILSQFGSRIGTAESVKFDIMGQALEISGTAKELLKQKQELLSKPDRTKQSQKKAKNIEKSIQTLENPMTDFVGVALLQFGEDGGNLEDLFKEVIQIFSPGADGSQIPPALIMFFSKEIRKINGELQELGLVQIKGVKYLLTDEGRKLFIRISSELEQIVNKISGKCYN